MIVTEIGTRMAEIEMKMAEIETKMAEKAMAEKVKEQVVFQAILKALNIVSN